MELLKTLIELLCASAGFWSFVTVIYTQKKQAHDSSNQMLLGLGHDRIIYLGNKYVRRGWVTSEEYENLHDYLYKPYKQMGGNGTAERVMKEVEKLPIQNHKKERDDGCSQCCGGNRQA